MSVFFHLLFEKMDLQVSNYLGFTGQRNDEAAIMANALYDTRRDICSFAHILYKVRMARYLIKKKKKELYFFFSSPMQFLLFSINYQVSFDCASIHLSLFSRQVPRN